MRWLARVFASAIARRVAYVLVALLLASLGIGRASAQSGPGSYSDQGTAYAAGVAWAAAQVAANTNLRRGPNCVASAAPAKNYRCGWEQRASTSSAWNAWDSFGTFAYTGGTCAARSPTIDSSLWSTVGGSAGAISNTGRSGSLGCKAGCTVGWFNTGDGTFVGNYGGSVCESAKKTCESLPEYSYNALTDTCEPKPPETCPAGQELNVKGECEETKCPAGMVMSQAGTCDNEKNECPAGEVKAPSGQCLPGDGQCAAGEAKGADGTCKKDADGDGEPDEDDPNEKSFSGGDSCDAPPSCSGDPIMCGQARIQWRIDCNTRRNVNISGGMCGDPPICTGKDCKAMEYAQLLMQWRAACALEKGIGGGGSTPDPNVAAIKDALTGNAGTPDIGEEGDPSGAFSDESGYGEDGPPGNAELDTAGFGFGRTCPTIPDVSVFGQNLHFDTGPFCQWLVLGGQIVLAMAALLSLRIISSSGGDS